MRRFRRAVKWLSACGLLCLSVAALPPLIESAGAATTMSWSAPTAIGSGESIDQISCPSTNLCVGVGGGGDVFTSTNPTGGAAAWTRTFVDHAAGSFDGLTSISCPSTSLCVAVDDSGFVFTSTNPTGGAGAWSDADVDGTTFVDAVACPSTTLCVAVDDDGNVLTSPNPAGGPSAWSAAVIDTGYSFDWVDCASASFCVAVDDNGHAFTSSSPSGGATAWTSSDIDAANSIEGVSCPSVSFCVAGDDSGNLLTTTNPTGGSWGIWSIDPGKAFFAVGCAGQQLCVAVDQSGLAFTSFNPTGGTGAWSNSDIDGSNAIYSVQCAQLQCLAGGGTGNVEVGVVAGLSQSISFTSSPPHIVGVGSQYTVSATGGASGNPVLFSIDSTSAATCSISGSTVTAITAVGAICRVDANQAGSVNYLAAPQAVQVFYVTSPPIVGTSPKVTRGAIVISVQCFVFTPCSGSMRLTQVVTHHVTRGHRLVKITSTRTLGERAVSLTYGMTTSVLLKLNRVGEAVIAGTTKHAVTTRLLYFRGGTEVVIPLTLKLHK